jgi:preprotein translocase subunit SecE
MPKTGTPSRSQQQRTASSSRGGLLGWRPRWIMDIISELKKVVWPSREDTLYMAVVVVIVTLIFGAILGGIDFFFAYLIDKAILDPNAWLQ